MSKLLTLSLYWVLFTCPMARAWISAFPEKKTVTVKVFTDLDQSKGQVIEGSGVLMQDGDHAAVLTASHVTANENTSISYRIQLPDGKIVPAQWGPNLWMHGLAILTVSRQDLGDRDFANLATFQGLDRCALGSDYKDHQAILQPRSDQDLTAEGYPVGQNQLRVLQGKSALEVVPQSKIISEEAVYSVRNLFVEPGFSGGPVKNSRGCMVGIMSHATNTDNPTLYLIPFRGRYQFIRDTKYDETNLTEELIMRQHYSSDRPEVIQHRWSSISFEKRDGKFFALSWSEKIDISPNRLQLPRDSMFNIAQEMKREQFRHVQILEIGGVKLTAEMSLAELIHRMVRTPIYKIQDAEYDFLNTIEKYPQVPRFFKSCDEQRLVYQVWYNGKPYTSRTFDYILRDPKMGMEIRSSSPYPQGWRTLTPDFVRYEAHRGSTVLWRENRAQCLAQGGKLEDLDTKAGLFPSCHVTINNKEVWYGPVPLTGILKVAKPKYIDYKNWSFNSTTEYEITEVDYGKPDCKWTKPIKWRQFGTRYRQDPYPKDDEE